MGNSTPSSLKKLKCRLLMANRRSQQIQTPIGNLSLNQYHQKSKSNTPNADPNGPKQNQESKSIKNTGFSKKIQKSTHSDDLKVTER